MKLNTMIRVLCIASVAAVALMSVALQPSASHGNASIREDFLTLSRTGEPVAKAAPVLKDWEFTRARPPKCPFF